MFAMAKFDALANMHVTPQEVANFYSNWTTFDGDVLEGNTVNGPRYAAEALSTYVKDTHASVLDVGAATGYVGEELKKLGFDNVDGLDPSELLEKAREKGIYKNYIKTFFGWEMDSHTLLDDDSYDHLTCAGSLGGNHLGADCLLEMLRVVRPGGICVISSRVNFISSDTQIGRIFEPLMEKLVSEGKCERLERTIRKNYFCAIDGVIFVLKKI